MVSAAFPLNSRTEEPWATSPAQLVSISCNNFTKLVQISFSPHRNSDIQPSLSLPAPSFPFFSLLPFISSFLPHPLPLPLLDSLENFVSHLKQGSFKLGTPAHFTPHQAGLLGQVSHCSTSRYSVLPCS